MNKLNNKNDWNIFDDNDNVAVADEYIPTITHEYDDIINLARPESKYPKMSMEKRAAQFSPFAALTGHKEAVLETERLTEEYIELTESEMEKINEKLKMILENIKLKPQISVTYFVPDERKEGGEYVTVTGVLKKFKEHERAIVLSDGKSIPLDRICDIDSDILNCF